MCVIDLKVVCRFERLEVVRLLVRKKKDEKLRVIFIA